MTVILYFSLLVTYNPFPINLYKHIRCDTYELMDGSKGSSLFQKLALRLTRNDLSENHYFFCAKMSILPREESAEVAIYESPKYLNITIEIEAEINLHRIKYAQTH